MLTTTTAPARKTAPGAGVAATKNRVWGFFEDGVKRAWEIDPQVVERHLEKTTAGSRNASGVPHWPSRDPIGERGGLNIYGFVGNDGVNWWDYLGYARATYANYEIVPSGNKPIPHQWENRIIGLITVSTSLESDCTCKETESSGSDSSSTPDWECKGSMKLSVNFNWENQHHDGMSIMGPGKGGNRGNGGDFAPPKMELDGLGGADQPLRKLTGESNILWDGELDEDGKRKGKGSQFSGSIAVDEIPCKGAGVPVQL